MKQPRAIAEGLTQVANFQQRFDHLLSLHVQREMTGVQMVFRAGQPWRFNTFALGVRAARPQPTADWQRLQQGNRPRKRIEAAFMRHRAAKIGDRAD
ncbi:hypothetical protein D3C87_1767090 [compost metagenome]